jgi:hypothetical protein
MRADGQAMPRACWLHLSVGSLRGVNQTKLRYIRECLLLALSGHFVHPAACPLLGVKRTFLTLARMSAFDPKRTFP